MKSVLKQLPPMSALRPFEAAARHNNFTAAAQELSVTQAAISKQIRQLEEHLGTRLFFRNGRNLELTAAGRDLHESVALGLGQIASRSRRLRETGRWNKVTIAMRLSFALQFISPRLERLLRDFPHVEFEFTATPNDPADLMERADFAIVLGHEPQPQLAADHLLTEFITPVCSPAFLNANPTLRSVADIPRHNLLHLNADHWQGIAWAPVDWSTTLSEFGVEFDGELRGPSFNSFDMLLKAAVAGLGLAVAWQYLVADLIETGHLIFPFENQYYIGRRHYFLYRSVQSELNLTRQIRAWFLEETRAFR